MGGMDGWIGMKKVHQFIISIFVLNGALEPCVKKRFFRAWTSLELPRPVAVPWGPTGDLYSFQKKKDQFVIRNFAPFNYYAKNT